MTIDRDTLVPHATDWPRLHLPSALLIDNGRPYRAGEYLTAPVVRHEWESDANRHDITIYREADDRGAGPTNETTGNLDDRRGATVVFHKEPRLLLGALVSFEPPTEKMVHQPLDGICGE